MQLVGEIGPDFFLFCTLYGLLAADGIYLTVQISLDEYRVSVRVFERVNLCDCFGINDNSFARRVSPNSFSLCAVKNTEYLLKLLILWEIINYYYYY